MRQSDAQYRTTQLKRQSKGTLQGRTRQHYKEEGRTVQQNNAERPNKIKYKHFIKQQRMTQQNNKEQQNKTMQNKSTIQGKTKQKSDNITEQNKKGNRNNK